MAAPVHNWMPAILKRSDEGLWLDPRVSVIDLVQLLSPYPEDKMEAYPVLKAVNSLGKDEPAMAEPLSEWKD